MTDVCLFLEGTYPFVSGGVSGCVHQLISMLPNTSFHLVYIGSRSTELLTPKYKIPPNVVGITEYFLFDDLDPHVKRDVELRVGELEALSYVHEVLHRSIRFETLPMSREELAHLSRALALLFPADGRGARIFQSLASRSMWTLLRSEYERFGEEMPFVDFFYTWRSAHLPIYRMLSNNYPEARVYHSLCTGYAGVAGAIAAFRHDAPFFVTEHGIYAHERAVELAEADWLYKASGVSLTMEDVSQSLKRWWIDFFRNMSRLAYSFASEIITLYDGNRIREIRDGAPPERIRIIPNGINRRFQGLRRKNPSWKGPDSGEVFRLGFVGRVVSIKDVKTLIKAVCAVAAEYPKVKCQVIGPTDEEPDYYRQCREMVEVLGLKDVIEFCGKKNVVEVYPEMDLLLLTSISEAQPLVILEANCAGVPAVATRVGSCQELLEGVDEDDRALGRSGLLAPIGNSDAIASRILEIVRSPDLWERMSLAGMKRVEKYYDERDLTAKYGVLYREHASRVAQVPGFKPGVLPWQE